MKRSLLLLTVLMSIVTASAQNSKYYSHYFRVPYTEGAPNFDKQKVVCPPADSLVYEMQFDFSDDLATAKEPVAVYLHEYNVDTKERFNTKKIISADRDMHSQVENKDNGVNLIDYTCQFFAEDTGNIFIYYYHTGPAPDYEIFFDYTLVFPAPDATKSINERNNATFKQKLNSFQLKP